MATLVLVACVILFFATQKFVNFVAETVLESNEVTKPHKHSRVVAAVLLLRFVTLLITVGSSLALALGFYKAFGEMAKLVLPEKAFGLIVLVSYCGLASVVMVVLEDLREAFKRLLTRG